MHVRAFPWIRSISITVGFTLFVSIASAADPTPLATPPQPPTSPAPPPPPAPPALVADATPPAPAATSHEPVICSPKDASLLKVPGASDASNATKLDHLGPDTCPYEALFTTIPQKLSSVRYNYTVAIYFDNGNTVLSDAGFTQAQVTIGTGSNNQHKYTVPNDGNPAWKYFVIYIDPTLYPNAQDGDLVQIQVGATNVSDTLYNFRFIQTVSPYGVGNSHAYAWFPIALFSTDFKSNTSGISLAAMPVGLAAGVKLYPFNNQFYIGGSGILNWLISPEKNATGTATGNYNFAGGTIGALIDINNLFYVGYAYGIDLTSAHNNPGNLFVLGVAPGLVQLLQSKP